MMTKRQATYYKWLQSLNQAGWNVSKEDAIKFNHGSETAKHQHAKLATASILKDNDYRIDTEVVHAERGEVDVCAIPTKDDQQPFAVELETSPTEETVSDKLVRYYEGTPWSEVWVVNLNEVPLDVIEMKAHIREELGL